ncbi:MAG: hypothetical protein NVS4B9_23730 [Ktedonobacteraceae bacterium]
MTQYTVQNPSDHNDDAFDLNQIFIGRDQQLDLFEFYLKRWKDLLLHSQPDNHLTVREPSPNEKIQGLVVLLYGRGGFGKSTLLRHYRNIVFSENQIPQARKIGISHIIDWEYAITDRRGLFKPPVGKEIDAAEYFKVLSAQFAIALEKKVGDFKHYQRTIQEVDEAKKQAKRVLENLQSDERFAPLRWIARGRRIRAATSYACRRRSSKQ